MKNFFIILFIAWGGFFVWENCLASNVIINEIGASETTNHEWLEILNITDESVDLLNWKFWENETNYGLSVSTTDSILDPGEYGVICQDENIFLNDYPNFNNSIFDSSWGTLKEGGEEIGLKDSGDIFIEQFSYLPITNFSLERSDPLLDDYTENNWQEHKSGNSLGQENSNYISGVGGYNQNPTAVVSIDKNIAEVGEEIYFDASNSTDDILIASYFWDLGNGATSTEISFNYFYNTTGTYQINLTVWDDDLASSTTSTVVEIISDVVATTTPSSTMATTTDWSQIKINEIVSNPEFGNEWVELYNNSTSTFLLSGNICDSTGNFCKAVSGTISGLEFLVVEWSVSYLNNTGDSVVLKNESGAIIDEIIYGGSLDTPEKGQSLIRKIDGLDTDSFADWAITTEITKGLNNILQMPVVPQPSGGGPTYVAPNNVGEETVTESFSTSTYKIIINEIYPDPENENDEFIELKNLSASTLYLNKWIIKDAVKEYIFSGNIEANGFLVIKKQDSGIFLNNYSSETVELLSPDKKVFDSVYYKKAETEMSFSFVSSSWVWSMKKTPGEENVLEIESIQENKNEVEIIWDIDCPENILVGEEAVFDASLSADPRGGEFEINWQLEDVDFVGNKFINTFVSSGEYILKLSATSSMGTIGVKEIIFDVWTKQVNKKVVIDEIMANPEGEDKAEYIKIKNISFSMVDISNWKILNKNKKYLIPTSTIILSGQSLKFYKTATKFSLSNTAGEILLLDVDNLVEDKIVFGKSKQGEVLNLNNLGLSDTQLSQVEKIIEEQIKKINIKKAVPKLFNDEIKNIRNLENDSNVITRGVVVALPGVLGSQYFYISDVDLGIQIYKHGKDFLDLKIGDQVEVMGVLSESRGVKRIKISEKENIDILSIENEIFVLDVGIKDLAEEYFGSLVRIKGEITQIKTGYLYLDDGDEEIKVYFKTGANINKKDLKVGQILEVVGVFDMGTNAFWVMPRNQNDLKILGESEYFQNQEILKVESQEKQKTENYLSATFGGLTALVLGGLARARGFMVFGFAKKVLKVAVGFIRRG